MDVLYIGAESTQGNKKEGGQPYGPFYEMIYAIPAENHQSANRQVVRYGSEVRQVKMTPEAFQQCATLQMCMVRLEQTADPRNPTRLLISSVKSLAKRETA